MPLYSIYAAPWNGPKSYIDFTTPIATSATSPVILAGIRGVQTTGTRYLAVRKSTDGIEEQNWNVIAFSLTASDWQGNYPAAPYHLRARVLEDDRVELTWEYQLGSVKPDGFHVYADNIFLLSVPYQEGIQQVLTPSIPADTLFAVRAYRGSNIEQNTDTVLVAMPTTLVAVAGGLTETWSDE